jgi:predicted nucleic acid-binding Zn ribbon protein
MKRIRDLMGDVLREEGAEELETVVRLREAWADVVGEKKAGKTAPYKLEGGRLYIKVESHVWAQELHYDVEKIKRRIKKVLGIEIDRIITKS